MLDGFPGRVLVLLSTAVVSIVSMVTDSTRQQITLIAHGNRYYYH